MLETSKSVLDLSPEERTKRMVADILRFNIAGIFHAYQRLSVELTAVFDQAQITGQIQIDPGARASYFSDAWTMIDCAHIINEVLRREKVPIEPAAFAKQVHDVMSPISKLRNSMDHIPGSIGNYVGKIAKPMPPLLGVMSAVIIPDVDKSVQQNAVHTLALSGSQFHHKVELNLVPDVSMMFPMYERFNHLRLFAFDGVAELSKLLAILGQLRKLLGDAPEEELLAVIITMEGG